MVLLFGLDIIALVAGPIPLFYISRSRVESEMYSVMLATPLDL